MADSNGTLSDAELVEIELDIRDLDMRFTPRELRLIREHVGRSYSEIMADETSDDRFTVAAWLRARREGRELTWEQMDDVVISITNADAVVDPTIARPAGTSPSSATSTG